MGICGSRPLPEEDGSECQTSTSECQTSTNPTNNSSNKSKKVVEFGREDIKLNDLLASLRTGLVIAPTEFSVLPGGLSTTAKVTFAIGKSELQRRQQENQLKEESLHNKMTSDKEDGKGERNENEKQEEDSNESDSEEDPFKFKVTFEGHGWMKGLVMTLDLQPVVGPFADRNLHFHWRDNVLEVLGCAKGELQARLLPLSFENEVEFCKSCLQLTYQDNNLLMREITGDFDPKHPKNALDTSIPSLKWSAYRVMVANLDRISDKLNIIPAKLHHIFFGSQSPVDISITLWPRSYSTDASLDMKVKSGILFAELAYLVKEHLCSMSSHTIKLYNNYRRVHKGEVVSDKFKHLDCFVVAHDNTDVVRGSCTSLEEVSYNSETELVVSHVGKEIQSIVTDLEMPLKEFDTLVRNKFSFHQDSFLIILAEGDFAPQYTADDNWKCTYPFSIPDNSFGASLRRSFHKLRRGVGERPTAEINTSTSAPLMDEVIDLLSSDERRFPQNEGKYGVSIGELYKSMPMYQMSIEQCGLHPYTVIQVFEVTGPSIPITVRVVSGYSDGNTPALHGTQNPHTRLANIMDINPEWSVNTFLQYIDAVVSLSSSFKQKRLRLKDNALDQGDDLSSLTLRDLLDSWKPLWWAKKGCNRRQLTAKDIDPSEYLIVEKF